MSSTEIATRGSEMTPAVADVAQDVRLVARDLEEMKAVTSAMAVWFASKEEIAMRDAVELDEAVAIAGKAGWATDGLKRQARIARDRVKFYTKCRLAAQAGYCVVPNMPATLFAIRTKKSFPRGHASWESDLVQRSEAPAAGEGEYKDAQPTTSRRSGPGSQPGETITFSSAEDWQEIEFPISIARPAVMSAAAQAMALKVFDELAIVLGNSDPLTKAPTRARRRGRGDPILLGIVRKPGDKSHWYDPRVSFLIAWDLDTSDL